MLLTGFRKILIYLRVKDWWSYIIPPVISFYCIGLLKKNTAALPLSGIISGFLIFLTLTALVAAFGFLINEWSDIEDDHLAGKKNALREARTGTVVILFLMITAGITFTCFFLPWDTGTLALFILQLVLFILYSVPPFRLKRKRTIAMILDAVYSGTLFYAIALLLGGRQSPDLLPPIPVIFIWGFCRGFRNINYHFMQDSAYDARLHPSLQQTYNMEAEKKKLKYIVQPCEIAAYLVLLYFFPHHSFFAASYVLFLIYAYTRKDYIIPFLLKRKKLIDADIISDINIYYEIIMPLVTLGLVIYKDPRLVPLFLLYLSLFPQAFKWIMHLYMQLFKNQRA